MSIYKSRLFADKFDLCDFDSGPPTGIRKKRLMNDGLFLTTDTQHFGRKLVNNFIPLDENLISLKSSQKKLVSTEKSVPHQTSREYANQQLFEKKELGWSLMIASVAHFPVVASWLISELSDTANDPITRVNGIEEVSVEQTIGTCTNLQEDGNSTINELGTPENSTNAEQIAQSIRCMESNFEQFISSLNEYGLTHVETLKHKTALFENLKLFPYPVNLLKKISESLILHGMELELLKQSSLSQEKKSQKIMFSLINRSNSKSNGSFLINDSQAVDLLEKINRGYKIWLATKQQLVVNNEKLVLYVANQYKGDFMEFTDIAQEGQIGLIKAVDKFDFRLGYKFSTYAIYWIRSTISRSLSKSERTVRLPFRRMASLKRIFQCIEEQKSLNGETPRHEELAKLVNLSNEDLSNMLSISPKSVSLDAKVSPDDENTTLLHFLEQNIFPHPMTELSEQDLKTLLDRAIESLSKNESHIVNCRFGRDKKDEMTLQEIGDELSLTRERVRQIQCSALKKIKRSFGTELSFFM